MGNGYGEGFAVTQPEYGLPELLTALTLKYQGKVRDRLVKVVVTAFAVRAGVLLTARLNPGLFALWTWKLVLLFERSVQVTVQLAYPVKPTLTQLTVGASGATGPGASGATVLFSLTLPEGEEPAPLLASTRYKLLVLAVTPRVEVNPSPTEFGRTPDRAIAALVLVQVVPLLIEVCTWKLVSLFEASVQASVAWVASVRVTDTPMGATVLARLTSTETVEPVTFWARTR